MNYVFETFASGSQVDFIYTDFRNDFVRVSEPHDFIENFTGLWLW